MGTETASRQIARLAGRQHGHVTLTQLLEAGLTKRQVAGRVRAGSLVPRHRGVYAVGHVPATRAARFRAATLTFAGSVLSHRAAAALWGILVGAVPIEVTVATTAGRGGRDGILVHRAPLPPEHVTTRDGIPVTTLLRTLLDLAQIMTPWQLAKAFEEAQVQHDLKPEPLAVEVLSRRSYRGNRRLAELLDGAVDPERVRSLLELRFLRLCAAHGLPRPLVNVKIGKWTPDFRWPEAEVVVETDGVRFHRTAAKRRQDARKDAALRGLGLHVIRLTWVDVTEAPERTASLVRAALAGASSGGLDTA
jgi:predicted transcriptional regulator of viral defense system